MSSGLINRACSGCSGDYENPDLTAPALEEGDVENSNSSHANGPKDVGSKPIELEGDRPGLDGREALSDVRGTHRQK